MQWLLGKRQPRLTLGSFPPHLPFNRLNLSAREQAYHAMVVGATGAGKSKFLQSVFLNHLKNSLRSEPTGSGYARHGVTMFDPHNDLSYDILKTLVASGFYQRPDAYKRVVYIDFGRDYFVPLNVLNYSGDKHDWAEKLLEGMTRIWPELEEGSTFTEYFQAGAVTLMENDLPLKCLHKLYTDDEFLKQCLNKVEHDEEVYNTMRKFIGLSPRDREAEAGSTIRRAFQISFQTASKLSLGQAENYLPLRQYMDEGRFIIFNLAGISRQSRRIIGALLMVMLEQAAMSRFNILDKDARVQHTGIVDEWPTFAATRKTMQEVLSQGRKFGFNLYLACQSLGQIDTERLSYAFDNCRLQLYFALGPNSSETASRQIGQLDPYAFKELESASADESDLRSPTEHRQYMPLAEQARLWANELEELDTRWCYAKVANNKAVKIRTLNMPDVACEQDELDEVIDTYHGLYQRSRKEAEQKVAEARLNGVTLRDDATVNVLDNPLEWLDN